MFVSEMPVSRPARSEEVHFSIHNLLKNIPVDGLEECFTGLSWETGHRSQGDWRRLKQNVAFRVGVRGSCSR